MDTTTVCEEMRSTGRMMGRIEGTRPGSDCVAGAVTALAPTARAAGRCGTTGMRRSTHPANSNPAPAAGSATTIPTRTMVPRSTPKVPAIASGPGVGGRSEEHTSELQSRLHLVCRLLLEKKKKKQTQHASEALELRVSS